MKPIEEFFSAEELDRLGERARLGAHEGINGEILGEDAKHSEQEKAYVRDFTRILRGLAGLRVAATGLALQGNIEKSLHMADWGAWFVKSGPTDMSWAIGDTLDAAIKSVAPRIFEVEGLAERLAELPFPNARATLARHIPQKQGQPILAKLAKDASPHVRSTANQRLLDQSLKGDDFPISTRGHSEKVLEPARRVLTSSAYSRNARSAIVAFARLRDPLAVACWERLFCEEGFRRDHSIQWLRELLRRKGGTAAFLRALRQRGDFAEVVYLASNAASIKMSSESRLQLFYALLREYESMTRQGDKADTYMRDFIARFAAAIAPRPPHWNGEVARSVLQAMLGLPLSRALRLLAPSKRSEKAGWDFGASNLSDVFKNRPLGREVRSALVLARRAGAPGVWNRVPQSVYDSLGPDPVLRASVLQALDSEKPQERAEAVRALFGPQYLAKVDGPKDDLARRLYERPNLREAVLQYADSGVSLAIPSFVAGDLPLDAVSVLLMRLKDEHKTQEVWQAIRAFRRRVFEGKEPAERDEKAVMLVTNFFSKFVEPGSTWHPADLAFARMVLNVLLTGAVRGRGIEEFVRGVRQIECEESDALLEEALTRATPDKQKRFKEELRQAEL